MNYLNEFESKQNYNSASFDFCINESKQIKCDYVQKVGTDLVSMSIRKSILTPKIFANGSTSTRREYFGQNHSPMTSNKQPPGSYTKYSIELTLLNNRITLGHLNVIQCTKQNRLHIEFDSYKGQTILLASLNVTEKLLTLANSMDKIKIKDNNRNETSASSAASISVKTLANTGIAQIKLNIPELVIKIERYLHFDYSLLAQVNLLLSLKIIPAGRRANNSTNYNNDTNNHNHKYASHWKMPNGHSQPQLAISFDIKSSAEMFSTSLVSKSSIELKSKFFSANL